MNARIIDICAADYHERPELSRSQVWDYVNHGPAWFKRHVIDGVTERTVINPAFSIGTAFHDLVVPSKHGTTTHVVPGSDPASKAKLKVQFIDDYMEKNPGANVINEDMRDMIEAMADSIWDDEVASWCLDLPGANEVVIVWEDDETGLKLRAMLDKVSDLDAPEDFGDEEFDVIFDLKSTGKSVDDSQKSIGNFGYFLQNAWYSAGLTDLTGRANQMFFAFAEKKLNSPRVLCNTLDRDWIDLGERVMGKALERIARHTDTKDWTDRETKNVAQPIPMPRYVLQNAEQAGWI